MKIAVSGKGGVGKTIIAGTIARIFAYKGFKVIAIDADPNPNLALTLGTTLDQIKKIIPISENKALIEEKTGVSPESSGGFFRLSFRVDDIIDSYGMQTPEGIMLLVMGVVRSAGQGCMCPANALVRALLRHLLIKRNEVVILDMEAGTEHFGRRTVESVDIMLIVTDANLKSLETAKKIFNLSTEMGVKKVYIIGNKVLDSVEETVIKDYCNNSNLHLLELIPYDNEIRKSDIKGEILGFSTESPGLRVIQGISKKLLTLKAI